MRIESFIGLRFLRSVRQDRSISFITWASMAGVMLGVTALIVTISVMNGFRANLFKAVTGTQAHVRVTPEEGMLDAAARWALEARLAELPGVRASAPYFSRQVFLHARGEYRATVLRGIEPAREREVTFLAEFLRPTSLYDMEAMVERGSRFGHILDQLGPEHGGAGIILGTPLARALALDVGDTLEIVSPVQRLTPIGPVPLLKKVRVAGVFETGIGGTDEVLAYVELALAQKLFRLGDAADGLALKLDEPEDIDAAALRRALPGFAIRTWAEDNRNVFQVMKLEKLGLFLILTLIIVVAFFNIISSLVTQVIEKKKGIAILKTLGATDGVIRRIFFMQGFWIGTVGTVAGVTLGLIVCWVIATFDFLRLPPGVYPVSTRIPVLVDPYDLLTITAASFVICISVTLYPATRAAQLEPVRNLRNE